MTTNQLDTLRKPQVYPSKRLRIFRINRLKDGKDISGTGKVIEGVQFSNGQVVICWRTKYSSIAVFRNMEEFVQVHAKPFFKENEFQWIKGYDPNQQLNDALDEVKDYVMRKHNGIQEKAKGDIIAKIMAMKRTNQREVDPIIFNKRNGESL